MSKYLRYGIIEDLDTVRYIPYGTFWGVKLSRTPLTWLSPFVFFGLRLALSLFGPSVYSMRSILPLPSRRPAFATPSDIFSAVNWWGV